MDFTHGLLEGQPRIHVRGVLWRCNVYKVDLATARIPTLQEINFFNTQRALAIK